MQSEFEQKYRDVLQNIESSIVGIYREYRGLADFQVDAALEALGRTYHRQTISGAPVMPKGELARKVYDAVKLTCDWRLGQYNVVDEEEQPIAVEPITVDEIQSCLKRVRKSIEMWNKGSGSQGYLNYVDQSLP